MITSRRAPAAAAAWPASSPVLCTSAGIGRWDSSQVASHRNRSASRARWLVVGVGAVSPVKAITWSPAVVRDPRHGSGWFISNSSIESVPIVST